MDDVLRLYPAEHVEADGYPPEWHQLPGMDIGIKHLVRKDAGNRCVRCMHPYTTGQDGGGEWSRCDAQCLHGGPAEVFAGGNCIAGPELTNDELKRAIVHGSGVDAHWRILTVHHLNGVKTDCRWWNLAALCQRCHLQIQGKVQMERVYALEHSEWFKPYAAGWYAFAYHGEDLTREQALERMDELLSLERLA